MPRLPPYLGEFADEDAEWLASAGEQRRVRAGEEVITEGVTPEHIHFVLEGEFVVSSRSLGDPEIQRIGPGEVLGEVSYINQVPPGGSVRAATDGVLMSVRRADIDAKVAADPAFASRFRKVISEFAVSRILLYSRRFVDGESPPPAPSSSADDDLRVHELIEKLLRGEF
ncbi:Crp/Fnr family transcriptional regulator [Longimicrobium sp.]|uniref:Crp/Fnr family transcriptional regulator n=1 Tax=Longimicrobium sp. TaxID=2029185 RepID=UPI002BE522A4|nr:cyclic nucleotide-binding domain-containing protein [Longimicrobium sp.]HSU15662.1 cyclic nucleotide-binding domain-containing protein [Longimicrobium sp.]